MLKCPVCDSEDVRVSFSLPPWECFYRWQGLQRYRCRECRAAFHVPLAPGEEFAPNPKRRRRSRERQFDQAVPAPDWRHLSGWRQKAVEAAFFLVLVVVFYTALKVVIS